GGISALGRALGAPGGEEQERQERAAPHRSGARTGWNWRSTASGSSTQSATKTLVSRLIWRSARRFEAKTRRVPSKENMGKASNVPEWVICSRPVPSRVAMEGANVRPPAGPAGGGGVGAERRL